VYGWWTDVQKNLPFVITCVVLISVLPRERFLSALVAGCYLAVGYTVLELLLHPAIATVNLDGNVGWRGAFGHKNEMGPFMVFAILVMVSFDQRSLRRVLGVATACVLVIESRSTTALGAGLVTLLVVWMLRRLVHSDRQARASIIATFLAAIVAGWILYSTVVPSLLGVSGKESTLTGRTEIWAGVWKAIAERPWQGYGIGGVWLVPSADPARSILEGLGFTVYHSHNGYLEIMLLTGFVGLALFIWLMVSLLRLSLLGLRRDPNTAVFAAGYVVLIAVLCITEVTVFGMWLSLLAAFQSAAVADRIGQRDARRERLPLPPSASSASSSTSGELTGEAASPA
jgi:O-antigen ligase